MLPRNTIFFIAVALVIVLLGGLLYFGRRTSPAEAPFRGTLEMWGVFDDPSAFAGIARQYKTERGVEIVYQKKNIDTYERDLLEAFAAGRGPDMFMIHNAWVPEYRESLNVLAPAPPGWVTPSQVQGTFPDTVASDFVTKQGEFVAVPLFVDSLALYYNRDLLNTAGIAAPPTTWAQVFDAVEKLTQKDERGRITRAGLAMGTAKNVNRSTDIVALLMMQSGSTITDRDRGTVTFDDTLRSPKGGEMNPGEDALRFYTDFANPVKRIYTWDNGLDFSIDMFATQRAAMMINYQHHLRTLRAASPNLNVAVAPMPQIETGGVAVNYASYWGVAASRGGKNVQPAWRFLLWMSQKAPQSLYQQATGRPPARRDLIEELKNDPSVGVFARQALTARGWWQKNSTAVEEIFAEMIDAVTLGRATVKQAVDTAAENLEAVNSIVSEREEPASTPQGR